MVQYSERATLQQLSTKYCALHFKHLTVANMSDVRSKWWRGQRRRGGEAGGGSLAVSAQSVSSRDQCDHSRYWPGVILLKTELFSYLTIHKQGDI